MTELKQNLGDFWSMIGDIANAGNDIAATYAALVAAGLITPEPGYVAPDTTPVPPVVTESVWDKSWFLPVVAGATVGGGLGIYFLISALKK